MREVCVFLCPSVYNSNAQLVEGLKKNRIAVGCLDVQKDDYTKSVQKHFARLNTNEQKIKVQPLLCLCFEETRRGIQAAKDAGMCAIGIASNRIEYERLRSEGAHAVAHSMSDFLDHFSVRNYYQLVYLPYILNLRPLSTKKAGYPVSLLDTLSGRFNKPTGLSNGEEMIELDEHAQRIIPREVLGILPGSLADNYINNVGWPQDNIDNFHLDSREIERDVIRIFGRFYGYPDNLLRGYVTSGGTEGNFTGLWWNRDYLRSKSKEGCMPILFTSQHTHYSVDKASQQLAIETRRIKSSPMGDMDCSDLARQLNNLSHDEPDRPVLMNLNMGTTQTGAIDNLPRVHKLLLEKVQARGQHFAIHLDAALLGAVLPIVKPFGDVDYFRDLGVNTIAISGHKFFGSICICGLCLTTAPFLDACFAHRQIGVDYVRGLHDQTPSGSRSGFVILSFHNTLCGLYMHTNASRLKQIVAQCYRNVDYFVENMSRIVGSHLVIHPKHSLNVCFPRPSEELMTGYQLMPVSVPDFHPPVGKNLAGVCILLNMDRNFIDRFMVDYAQDRVRH